MPVINLSYKLRTLKYLSLADKQFFPSFFVSAADEPPVKKRKTATNGDGETKEDEGDEEEDVDVDLNDPDIIDRSTLLRLLSHSWTALTVSVDDVPLPGEEGRDYIDITQIPSHRGESSVRWKRPG